MSRHRGAKLFRRYGLSKIISLLSPAYLLFVEWWPFHTESPDHYGRLKSLIDLLIFQLSRYIPLRVNVNKYFKLPLHTSGTFWEVTAPVKLPLISCFTKFSKILVKEWYLKNAKCSHLFCTKIKILQLKNIVKVHGVFPSSCY